MSKTVQIALVGVANHGHTILTAINKSPNLTLVACYDINPEANAACAAMHGCTAHSSYESLLADPQVEAVAIVTPNHLHAAQIEAAFAAGKHVFVDKPITNTVTEGKRAVEQATQAGTILSPVVPVAPVAPTGPVAPAGPVEPVGPVGPVVPGLPCGP